MDDIAEHYHYIMRYHKFFYEELKVVETARKICEVYEPDVLKERSRNGLRVFVSETLVLKTRSNWIVRKR